MELRSKLKNKQTVNVKLQPFKTSSSKDKINQESNSHDPFQRPCWQCGYCDKDFKTSSVKKRHERIVHMRINPYKCSFCKKTFTTKSQQTTHERIHTEERPYNCSFCEKSFRDTSTKKRHENLHATKESLQNKKVDNTPPKTKADINTSKRTLNKTKKSSTNTPVKQSFVTTKKTHDVESSFQKKKVFKKACENEENTKASERIIYTGLKPYPCIYCKKSFWKKSTRRNHFVRLHRIKRYHCCTQCLMPFDKFKDLVSHMKTHKRFRRYRIVMMRG